MAANRTPVPLRLFRLARLAFHLVRGLAIAWLRYPKLTEAQRQAQKRRWSRTLLSILSVSVREKNAPKELPDCCMRSEEHTSELQSRLHLVCRLLLEKKKKSNNREICSVYLRRGQA